jgi:hypothetical protein
MSSQCPDLRPIYTTDARDRLVEVNSAFVRSVARVPESVVATSLIGRSIWDFIPGTVPRQLWRVLYDRVRALGTPIFVPLRDDTASERCVIDLELHPIADRSIRHVRECVALECRSAVALLDPNYPRDNRTLVRCAWCARIQVSIGTWEEIEQAQTTLRLEAVATLPTLRDAVCLACTQSVLKAFPARVA